MLLQIANFAYNNIKNTSTGFLSFELNYDYYSYILFEKITHFNTLFRIVKKLSVEL